MPERLDRLAERFGPEPLSLARRLLAAGHDAVIVGGPVRDVLRGEMPHDVDLATSAAPDTIRTLFPRTFVQGSGERHGTIGVLGADGTTTYEITTYRRDVATDGRHAVVAFTTSLDEDLRRRDFTINAIAVRPDRRRDDGEIVDPFGGRGDLAAGRIRAVGDPATRFAEDHLRVLRAYRFAARFGFTIESVTRAALRSAVGSVARVSRERIRDEFRKMFDQTREPGRLAATLRLMHDDGLFALIVPEVAVCDGVRQNAHHAYDVLTHLFMATDAVGPGNWRLRFAMLLHDIGKPATRSVDAAGRVHFFGHEQVGAELADTVLRRLAFSTADRAWVVEAVRQHMRLLQIDVDNAPRALRRIARDLQAGVTLEDLLAISRADTRGAGVTSAFLDSAGEATLCALIADMQAAPVAISIRDLALNGHDLMEALGLKPGPELGMRLRFLLDAVIEQPELNTREALLKLARAWTPPAISRVPASRRIRHR